MSKPFVKNDPRINRAGRPRKEPGKSTEEIKQMALEFLAEKLPDLYAIYDELKPREKHTLLTTLFKMTVPPPVDELARLSDEQLNELISRLREQNLKII